MEWSDVLVPGSLPRAHGAFTAICAGLVVIAAAWAGWLPVDVVVRASGLVRPATNVSSVKNAVAGEVSSKEYRAGTWVEVHSVLWRIDTKAAEMDRQNTEFRLQRLRDQGRELDAFASALATGDRAVAPGLDEASSRAAAYFAHLERLELLASTKRDKWAKETRLPGGLVSNQTLVDLSDEWRLADLDVVRFRAQEREAVFEENRRLLSSIEELVSHLAEVEKRLAESVVRAPISGVIEDVRRFNEGDLLLAGEEVVRVVPSSREGLRIELRADPRDVAELRVGQPIRCLFPGLPPSRFGPTTSQVETIASDVSLVNGQATFLVEARLPQAWLEERSGRRVTLKSGMPVEGRIVVGRKTVLASFFEKMEFLP